MGKSLVIKVLDKRSKLSKISLLASRFSLLASRFSLLAIHISLSLIPAFNLNAQVIIKEKVEINPQGNILPEYPQSTLDPCLNINRPPYYQSVYSCSGYPVEPYQQNFPWQASSNLTQLDSATVYNVEIISGTEYAYFYKVGYWDIVNNMQVDPEYVGSSLTGLPGVELAGWGEYRVYQGIGVWEREHFALYNIRFDNYDFQTAYVTVRITNTSTNDITEWHTTIVNPQYTLNSLGIDGDTVLHRMGVVVTPSIHNSLAFSCNQFGYGSCPPTNVTFNIEIIQGQEYGNIGRYNDFFGSFEYAPAYTGISYDDFRYGTYVFAANGLQPDSTAVVRIRQSSSDADIGSFEYTLYIKRNFLPPVTENGSIVIETNKNTAMPGDTLDILLKWEDGSNGIVDFADWQEFGVWLADGFGYGTLLDPVTGDTSDAFEVTGKELKLIVHQDVTDANKKIVIAAETEVAVLGGNRMIQNNPQPKTATKSTDKKNISNYRTIEHGGFVKANNKIDKLDSVDKDDGEINIDIIIGSQYLSGIKEIIINPFIVVIDPPVISAGDTARIIPKYMDENGNYVVYDSLQIFELGMLDGCPLGMIKTATDSGAYFYGVTQPFYFIADTSADSGSVNIRVGVIDMNPQNRSLTNNNSNIENDNPVSCANVSFVEDLYANGNVVLGSICATLPKCTENNAGKKPVIEVKDLPNGYNNTYDYCIDELGIQFEKGSNNLLGFFTAVWSKPSSFNLWKNYSGQKLFMDYQIDDLCYDDNSQVIQFGIKDNKLLLKSIVGYCGDINLTSDQILINSKAELSSKIPQDINSLNKAIEDFENSKSYDYRSKYVIEDVVWAHELKHKSNFQEKIVNKSIIKYDDLNYSKLDISCDRASDLNDVKEEMKENFNKKLELFEEHLIHEQRLQWGAKRSKDPYDVIQDYNNERKYTHNTDEVRKVIDEYILELQIKIGEILYGGN